MAKQTETLFKKRVLRDLSTLSNIYVLKTQERGRRGVPDLLVCYKGKFIALELKTETGKVDALQEHILETIVNSGGLACVVIPSSWETQYQIIRGL
jgi:hypothetical protein